MAKTIARRPPGELTDPVGMNYVVNRRYKQRLEELAHSAGVSAAVMFEQILDHVEVTADNVPTWWTPRPAPEELPINPD